MLTEFILSLVTMDIPPESTIPLRSSVTVLILSTSTLSISGSVLEEYRTLLLSVRIPDMASATTADLPADPLDSCVGGRIPVVGSDLSTFPGHWIEQV